MRRWLPHLVENGQLSSAQTHNVIHVQKAEAAERQASALLSRGLTAQKRRRGMMQTSSSDGAARGC